MLSILFYTLTLPVQATIKDNIYIGTWKSDSTFKLLDATQGKVLIRPYEDEESNLFLSLYLESSKSPTSALFIQTQIQSLDTILTKDSNSTLNQLRSRSNIKSSLNCSITSHRATCAVSSLTEKFKFTASARKLKRTQLQEPIVSYSFVISCVSITLLLAFSKHTQDCVASDRVAQKTSIEFLIFQSAIDFWYSVWHLYLSFNYFLAHEYLVLAGFMTFAVYLVIHGRLMMTVWKAQNPGYAQDGLILFKIRFAVFEGFWLIFIMSFVPAFILMRQLKVYIVLFSHNYLPMIYNSARYGFKHAIKPNIIVTISLARLALLLYLFGFAHEFMGGKRDLLACLVFTVYLFVQTSIVLLQNRNPKFFLPWFCRPETYSYLRDDEFERIQEKSECTICMTELSLAGHESAEVFNFSKTWHTPCKHMFHEDCLKTWMTIKMECPTCRSQLPFTEEAEEP